MKNQRQDKLKGNRTNQIIGKMWPIQQNEIRQYKKRHCSNNPFANITLSVPDIDSKTKELQ